MHFNLGNFVDAQHLVLVKVRLLDHTFLECDFTMQGGGQGNAYRVMVLAFCLVLKVQSHVPLAA